VPIFDPSIATISALERPKMVNISCRSVHRRFAVGAGAFELLQQSLSQILSFD
jgi:molybdenum cofactor biosynthesis enzyme